MVTIMADKSPIEWLRGADGEQGATWNPITGCSIESPGCRDCYAATLAGTRLRNHPSRAGLTTRAANGAYVFNGEVRFNAGWLDQPLRWTRPRMVFVVAHGDLFHPAVPDAWIDKVFAVMARARWHTYQVLTKRAKRMREYLSDPKTYYRILMAGLEIPVCAMEWMAWPLPHVWIGVSAEDQKRADERVPELLATPAAVRWLSCEPLIGAIDLRRMHIQGPNLFASHDVLVDSLSAVIDERKAISWVVPGGESGRTARPSHPDWFRSLRDQCVSTGTAFLFKQHGAWLEVDGDKPTRTVDSTDATYATEARRCDGFISLDGHFAGSVSGTRDNVAYRGLMRVGKKAAGRTLDGREWNEFPGARS